ncbi:MAG: NAD-binding protein [Methanosarcinales archaeon]|nr:NAD-binding protein [Methanosarcinales archaeon]
MKKKESGRTIYYYIILFLMMILLYSYTAIFIKSHFEGESFTFIESVYFVIITMTTVGYGDIVMTTPIGMIFSIVVAISGVIMLFALLFPLVVMPWIERQIQGELPTIAPTKLNNHVIICGYNKMVESLVNELEDNNMPFIVVDDDEKQIRSLLKEGTNCIFGDPVKEKVLDAAGVCRARLLIANQNDEKNASIILTAREFCTIEILAIVNDKNNADYLKYAGANRVVSPKSLLGSFIGRKAVEPLTDRVINSTAFMDDLEIAEFPIYPGSSLLKKSLKESRIRELTGANIVGIWKGGKLSLNPMADDVIKRNSILLVVGNKQQLRKFKRLTH